MESPTINSKLRAARKEYRLTVEQASERVGVDIRTYRRWERGSHTPHFSTLRKLCELFDATVEDLGFTIE